MLQILFAVILLELKCILYLCRQGYLLSPRFCSEEHSVTSTAVRTPAQHIRCVADSQGKHSFEVLSIGGLQAHQESWIAENKVQTTCKPFSAFQASAQGSRVLSSASLSPCSPFRCIRAVWGTRGWIYYCFSPSLCPLSSLLVAGMGLVAVALAPGLSC